LETEAFNDSSSLVKLSINSSSSGAASSGSSFFSSSPGSLTLIFFGTYGAAYELMAISLTAFSSLHSGIVMAVAIKLAYATMKSRCC